jgi:hypothetical protein
MRVVLIVIHSVLSVRAFRNTAQRAVRWRPLSSYEEGYQAAIDKVVSMLDNTMNNEEVMTTLPAKWILGILRVSLTNPE